MRRWRILTIGHTEFFLHPAVLPFAVYVFLIGHGTLWLLSALSILMHEAAHALTAAAFKCAPSAIEMTPLGAVMFLEDEMKLPPPKRAVMLFAGPAASLALTWFAVSLTDRGWITAAVGMQLFLSNIAIVLINMMPVFPLDGGRLLHLGLACFLPARIAAVVMQVLGTIAGLCFIGLNLAVSLKCGGWNLSLACAGCSILYSTAVAMTTSRLHELRMFMERKITLERNGYRRCKILYAMGNLPLRSLLRALTGNRQLFCIAVEPGSMSTLGFISENQLIQHYLNHPGATVSDVLALSKNTGNSTKDDTI